MFKRFTFSAVAAVVLTSGGLQAADMQNYTDEQMQAKVEMSRKQEKEVAEKADAQSLLKTLSDFSVGDKKPRAVNYDQSSLEELKGSWIVSYTIIQSYTDTLTLDSISWALDSVGYAITGKNEGGRIVLCVPNLISGYKYACVTNSVLSGISQWYVFNKSGNSLSGGYYIGTSTSAAYNFLYTPTRYPLSGTGYSATGQTTTVTSATPAPTTSATTTSAPPPPPSISSTSVSCNDTVAKNISIANAWHLLGAVSDGCTISGLKTKGATAVFPYSADSGAYSTADNIANGQGFWIKSTVIGGRGNDTPPPAPSTACEDITSKLSGGKWYLLTVTKNACSVSNLKSAGATAIYPFDERAQAYHTDPTSVYVGYGFWIKK